MSKPKNVIILSSDEMRGDCPGFMGNPDCQTPHLDRFAEKGIVFENHFTVHGKCVPARIAMMTGRYSHTDGFRTIHQHLPTHYPNLLGHLKEQGYESAVFGLNHVWENFFGDNTKSNGYVDYHSFTKDYFDTFNEKKWSVPPASDLPSPTFEGGFDYRGRVEEPLTGHCDRNRSEQAIHYLKNVRDRSRPFYLHVNLSSPHPPYSVEEPFFSMYDRQKLKAWPHTLPENAPLHLRKMREIRTGFDIPETTLREIQAVYYGEITRVDSHLGAILDTIEREGLFEDSIILFWVDHGDFAGQYGLVEKWDTAMNDCIMHVPYVLYSPDLPKNIRVDSLTEHTDITPTILELLGMQPNWGIHGESLVPTIEKTKKKEAVFANGGHEEEMWHRFHGAITKQLQSGETKRLGKQQTYQECPETMARTKMVRTDKWKLVIRLTGGNELYDMKNDPYELRNLWGQQTSDTELQTIIADLQQKMIEWCLRTDTDRPYQEEVGA